MTLSSFLLECSLLPILTFSLYSMIARGSFTRRTIEAYELHQDLYLQHWNTRPYTVPFHLNVWLARLPAAGLLLDVGCGPGQDTRYLRRRRFKVYGVDLTLPFLQAAKVRAPRLPIVQADMKFLPFSRPIFDGIWAAASLIHLSKPQARAVLKRLALLTKPGGWLGMSAMYGNEVGIVKNQWIPGRYLAKWHVAELRMAVQAAKWDVVSLERVKNQERKGSWINVLGRRPHAG